MSASGFATPAPRIVIVGSVNMDLVARMRKLPRPGETVTGESFQTIPGGKGANQAVAAARLKANVAMIGRIGDDAFGLTLRQTLTADRIDTSALLDTPNCSSGVALIGVDATGANSITVIPAANGRLTVADVLANKAIITAAQALVVQLETPLETIAAAIHVAQQSGVLTVLDPAPAPAEKLPRELINVDVLSPNQTEAEALTGIAVDDWSSAEDAARDLQRQGANQVVLKMGELGALVCDRDGQFQRVAAINLNVVDTTAAGDAFTAGLTVGLCEGRSLAEAARFGCLAGTLACTRFGAQPAMPTREEVESLAKTAKGD